MPIKADVERRNGNRGLQYLDWQTGHKGIRESLWHYSKEIRVCDDRWQDMKAWDAQSHIATYLVLAEEAINDAMGHACHVRDRLIRFSEGFHTHAGAESRVTGAHNADIALAEEHGLQEAGRQVGEESNSELDLAGTEGSARILNRNGQHARRHSRRFLLQELEKRWKQYLLSNVVHEEPKHPRACRWIKSLV